MDRLSEYQMMTSPDEWVHWPLLPLKKRDLVNQRVDLGMLREAGENIYQFSEGVMWKPGEERTWRTVNPQDLINDGWVVD
jgi:hypothetical protein